jgi:hypothetical protein
MLLVQWLLDKLADIMESDSNTAVFSQDIEVLNLVHTMMAGR